jgi:hypothetical protein
VFGCLVLVNLYQVAYSSSLEAKGQVLNGGKKSILDYNFLCLL